jgi:hypothetical protein
MKVRWTEGRKLETSETCGREEKLRCTELTAGHRIMLTVFWCVTSRSLVNRHRYCGGTTASIFSVEEPDTVIRTSYINIRIDI